MMEEVTILSWRPVNIATIALMVIAIHLVLVAASHLLSSGGDKKDG